MKKTETQNIEFKPNWRDEYIKVLSAFANTDGGTLIIGVDDNHKPIGVRNAKKLLEDIPNKVKDKLGIIPFVEIKKEKSKEIIYVSVNSSPVPASYNGRYFIRSGSTNLELSGNALTDFLMRKQGKTWDAFLEETADFNDIDTETIEKFKRYAKDRMPAITEEKDYKVIIKKLGLMGKGKTKRAAILLFGKNPQQFYLQAQLKIGQFLTETELKSTDVVEGNLFGQLEDSLDILRTKYLTSNVKFEGIHRRDILEYPYGALREAIINALIHRNYAGTSAVQIKVYPDKLIIMNEGELPAEVPVEKLKTNHLSVPRNALLAKVFYLAGFIETWGRGTIKIVEMCKEQGLPEPDFNNENGVMEVVLYKDKFTEEYLKKLKLNERQIKVVMYIKKEGKITNKEYRNFTGLSDEGARQDMLDLVKKGILERKGKGRSVHYVLKTVGD